MTASRGDTGTVVHVRAEDDEPVDEHFDELPDDLDPTSAPAAPYLFPNNNRRRVPGYLYLALGAGLGGLWLSRHGSTSVLVNDGLLFAALVLVLVGIYHLVAGWDLDVDEEQALAAAGVAVEVPLGHASAQMGWRGWLSRPTWRILWYSAEEPPLQRGLVLVDGHDGHVVSWFAEPNPEDWTTLDGRLNER